MDEKEHPSGDVHVNHTSKSDEIVSSPPRDVSTVPEKIVNASGHVQELDRNFNLLSIIAVGVVVGNVWAALGGSLAVAIYNGGPPGVIYEYITVSVFYWIVAASIAELASAIPSSAGVYHWASVTAGKYGRVVGFFAGWWNFFAWIFGAASMSAILGNQTVQMYAVYHDDFVPEKWHVFVSYLCATWIACTVVLFGNRFLPWLNNIGLFFILAGVFITIVVCAAMPGHDGRPGHASSSFVWTDWSSDIGYGSQGLVFCLGMLNGAYSVGTPDCVSHIAEEIPHPHTNVPKAIAAQMATGFLTGLLYLISILYAIHDLDALAASAFPLAEIYHQATGSRAGTIGLLVVIMLPVFCCVIGVYITCGRTLWTLARDRATPFPLVLARVHRRHRSPFHATLACGVMVTVLGCIYVGSSTAFNALVGSFVIMSTSSYVAAILPHLLSRRANILPGPFWMRGPLGFLVNAVAVAYMLSFIVLYCFPYALPVDAQNMNYACLIYGGLTVLVALWWLFGASRLGYEGPRALGGLHEVEAVKGKVHVAGWSGDGTFSA